MFTLLFITTLEGRVVGGIVPKMFMVAVGCSGGGGGLGREGGVKRNGNLT